MPNNLNGYRVSIRLARQTGESSRRAVTTHYGWRRAYFVLYAILSLLVAGCSVGPKKTVHLVGQLIDLSDSVLRTGGTDTVRFGHLHAGETAVKQLRLRNGSTQPLAILSIERTCGCTQLEVDSQPLIPGAQRAVTLSFDSRGLRGWQFKLVEIRFAQAAAPFRLYVEAEVE